MNSIYLFAVETAQDLLRQAAITASADIAEKALIARYDFYWAVATAVATALVVLISFLGFGAWKNIRAGIRNEVMAEVKNAILSSEVFKKEVAEAVGGTISAEFQRKSLRLERQIQLSKLQYLSNKVREAKGFSNTERDALYNQLIMLKDDPDIICDVDYLNSLEQVLDSFYSAALWSRMDDLDSNLGHVIKTVAGVVHTMAYGYALRVLGEIDRDEHTVANFLKYLELLGDHQLAGIGLPLYNAYLVGIDKFDDAAIDRMRQDVEDFSAREYGMATDTLNYFSDPQKLAREPRNRHRRVSEKVQRGAAVIAGFPPFTPAVETDD